MEKTIEGTALYSPIADYNFYLKIVSDRDLTDIEIMDLIEKAADSSEFEPEGNADENQYQFQWDGGFDRYIIDGNELGEQNYVCSSGKPFELMDATGEPDYILEIKGDNISCSFPTKEPEKTQPKITRLYILTERPMPGPHEMNTMNGLVYKVIGLDSELSLVHCFNIIDTWLKDTHPNNRSWGNQGIIANGFNKAEEILKEACNSLELEYGGRVRI